MENQKTPLKLQRVSESIYAGFWIRLGSMFLDAFFLLPLTWLVGYLHRPDQGGYETLRNGCMKKAECQKV